MRCRRFLFCTYSQSREERGKGREYDARNEGWAFWEVFRHKGLGPVFSVFCVGYIFSLMPVSVLFPLMTLNHFKGTEFQAGIIEPYGVWAHCLAAFIMGARVYKVNRVSLINWMYLVCGLTFLFSGVLPTGDILWFAVLNAIAGVFRAVYNSRLWGFCSRKSNRVC